ncbi:unnamed protein product [Cuscuta epithymum]|nr:unnamed protein product [Cuscuta epithymum]
MDMLHDGFGKYDLFNRNCEDFAKYCKTGYVINPTKAYQVACRLGLGSMGLAAVLNPTVPVGLSLGMGVNLVSRYANDIGVRREVNTWLKKMCKTWGCKLA